MYVVSENIFVQNLPVTCCMIFLWRLVIFKRKRRGWFAIIWLFMSMQIKYLKNAWYFKVWLMWVFVLRFCTYDICAGLIKQIIHITWFLSHHSSCVYHWYEWIHETCLGVGVCSVLNLEEGRSSIKFSGIWYPWGFFWHEAWSWGQKVTC